MLPNFLGIGTQRGATTWLFNCLREHPEVFVPDIKEISFFDIHYDKGLQYYKEYFKEAKDYSAIGEITPDYLYCGDCAEKIKEILGEIRLIAILREPVDRALSAYNHFRHKYNGWSFSEAIEKDENILKKGVYYKQLEKYYKHFQKNKIKIIIYEDLKKDNISAIQSIYTFLNINSEFRPSVLGQTINTKSFSNIRKILKKTNSDWIIKYLKNNVVGKTLRMIDKKYKERKNMDIDPAVRNKLLKYYETPNKKLEELLDRELTVWNIG